MKRAQLHKELRSGYTTGTCATAVAKAATWMLINQSVLPFVEVTLPNNEHVVLDIAIQNITQERVRCSTIKDAGDDPDITHGIEIVAEAEFTKESESVIATGKGIGIVTKHGLATPVGEAAINPVPRKMILSAIEELRSANQGIKVTLSAINGEELAKRTFNPQLGIIGGISILGTTGIVKPMSEEALKDSLVVKLKQLANCGHQAAMFCPGNYGKTFSKEHLAYNEEMVVLTSNYIGFMLEQAVINKFRKILLVGHLGKLVKLAGGIFQTHSRVADARNEILAAHYFNYSNDTSAFDQIMGANTTEEAVDYVSESMFWHHLSNTIKERAQRYIYDELSIEVILFSQERGMLGHSDEALTLMEEVADYE